MKAISAAALLVSAFAATAALPVYANPSDDLEGSPRTHFGASSVSRDQVKADATRRRSPDEYDGASRIAMGVQYPGKIYKHPVRSTLTRADVRAEYERARVSGELAALNSNDRYGLADEQAPVTGSGLHLASHD
jgi:hypothetical protein